MEEPRDLSDIAMSDQNAQTQDQDEESSGGLSLEAKAGLTLVCLLAVTFSYMVWQKWKEMEDKPVAKGRSTPEVQEGENPEEPPTDVAQTPGPAGENHQAGHPLENSKPPTVTLNSDGTGNDSLPPALNLETPDNDPSGDANPFASSDNQPARRPANIPTLEAPEATASNSAGGTTDDFNPFGDEFKQAPEARKAEGEPGTTAELTPTERFSPFGPAVGTAEPATDKAAESVPALKSAETEADPFPSGPQPKPTEKQLDPFATAPDPFAEPQPETPAAGTETSLPSLDFADGKPLPEEKPGPVKTAEADPFDEPGTKPDPFAEKPADQHPFETEKPVKVAPGKKFQEPLPLLEPVPERKSKTPADDPFGEFESVPAGAAQASSVTQVSPEPAGPKRSGTLADLNAPSGSSNSTNRNSSPFGDNPFAAPQPRPAASKFKLNPDGTYEIRQGDSYWIISRNAYGSSRYFRALAEYNRKVIGDPQQMTAGKKIMIPPVQELERYLSHLIPSTPAAPAPSIVMTSAEQDAGFFTDEQGNPMYRIQENDTLTGISQRHLGRPSRWIQIFELNRDKLSNPNQLKIGTTLKLPRDASRVRIVKGP